MNRVLVMLLLAVIASSATAEWSQIKQDYGVDTYANPNTIRKNGTGVKVWILENYNPAQWTGESSAKIQREYDCTEEASRRLYISGYSRNMGEGELLFKNASITEWEPVEPGSTDAALWKFVCGKRK